MKASSAAGNSPRVVIFLGAPGAGKGTQATLLSEKSGWFHFETSKVLEERFRAAREGEVIELGGVAYSFDEQKERWNTGLICDGLFVGALVRERLKKLCAKNESVVLSGSPRQLDEGRMLIPFLIDLYGRDSIDALYLEITERDTIARNSQRRICELMRHSILSADETKHLTRCPIDGSLLVRRTLDDPEAIKVRLQEFHEKTFPLFAFFKEQGIRTTVLNGSRSVSDVFQDVCRAVSI